MDLLALAEENFLITLTITAVIGLLHGAVLGRGIRNRFPSLKKHARIVSIILLILFSVNAIANVIKFAIPQKISVSDLSLPTNVEEGFSLAVNLLGLNAGIGTVIITFISLSLILFFRFADLHSIVRYFIFALSVVVLLVALIARFTDFVPTGFQIIMYALYQFGITLGLFLVTRRTEKNIFSDLE